MEKGTRLDTLDGLRGLFAFVILLHNCRPVTQAFSNVPLMSFIWNYGGQIGNGIFFMLSGFLISHIYHSRISNSKVTLHDYLLHRLRKLYPLYILTNCVALLTDILRYGLSAINLQRIILVVLLQSGGALENTETYNAPTWFVSALLVCYLVYYAIAYYGRNSFRYSALIALVIAWGYTLVIKDWTFPFCYGITGLALLNFFVGCALAQIYPKIKSQMGSAPVIGSMGILIVSFALMMRFGVDIICGNSHVAFALLLCPVIVYLALDSKLVGAFLRCNLMQYLGKLSMPIYFWHFVVYDIYCYIIAPDRRIGNLSEIQYIGYFLSILLWCILFQIWIDRKTDLGV